MDAKTTIEKIFAGNRIFVPAYQRAYSWDKSHHVNVFFTDIQDYMKSLGGRDPQMLKKASYYFGHFLFEKLDDGHYGVIDGQQRLTTITIFLAALFNCLESKRQLNEREEDAYMYVIKSKSSYRFSTVGYDDRFFKDYVIDHNTIDRHGLDTESKRRIADAYDYFIDKLNCMDEEELVRLLNAVTKASCTTHIVDDEAEAIQMFIFQNNRGKKPSNLEIIKAQFMYAVHLYAISEEERDGLIEEIKDRFEKIYKAISTLERYGISEDNVLTYTVKVYFNSLSVDSAIAKVNDRLLGNNRIEFIRQFTLELENSFKHITSFYKASDENIHVDSLIHMHSNMGIMMPFVIKAYKNGISDSEKDRLYAALESIFIRNMIINSRADLSARLGDVYRDFNNNVDPIICCVEYLKHGDGWWGYWNNNVFENSLQWCYNHHVAKFMLWKYENYLTLNEGKSGYKHIRYSAIIEPHLEHIAPKTENPANGYCEYDEEFRNMYLDCWGNYLLLSRTHNISIGNHPFAEKRATYTQLQQQREIREMTENECVWDKDKIKTRNEKIIKYILDNF